MKFTEAIPDVFASAAASEQFAGLAGTGGVPLRPALLMAAVVLSLAAVGRTIWRATRCRPRPPGTWIGGIVALIAALTTCYGVLSGGPNWLLAGLCGAVASALWAGPSSERPDDPVTAGNRASSRKTEVDRVQEELYTNAARIGRWYWNAARDEIEVDPAGRNLASMGGRTTISTEQFLRAVDAEERSSLRDVAAAVLRAGGVLHAVIPVRLESGYRWLEVHGLPVHYGHTDAAIAGTFWDVTDQHRYEEELRRERAATEEAHRSKSDFLVNISHEFRTPLTAIIGCADLMRPEEMSGDSPDLLNTIRSQSDLLHRLLNDVLDLSELEYGRIDIVDGPFEPCSLLSGLVGEFRPLAEAKGLSLQAVIPKDLPATVHGDCGRIRQVLSHLVLNAVKFTVNGHIRLEACISDDPDRADEADGCKPQLLTVSVSDTGAGIHPEKFSQVFSAFEQGDRSFTRRQGGTGLGLTICEHLIRLMNGVLEVDSVPGSGSTFTVSIPVREESSRPVDQQPSDASPASAEGSSERFPIRVLVAEDTPSLQFLMQAMIGPMVERVDVVGNGMDVLNTVAERGDELDLILMDVQMPVLDGLEATRRLRGQGFNTPIVALTAGVMNYDRRKTLGAGCDAHLTKPIDGQTLRDTFARLTRQKQTGMPAFPPNETGFESIATDDGPEPSQV